MTRRDDIPLPRRLLGVWAHPDDEAYLSAGLMARVAGAGGRVTVVTATDGELGFPDEDSRDLDARAALRRHEMRAAMTAAGVVDVRFLGWPDGGLAAIPVDAVAAQIADVIADVDPDMLITFGPDGVTGHDDHVAICAATTTAWQATGAGTLLFAANTTEWIERFRALHDDFDIWMTGEPVGVDDDDVVLDVRLDDPELDRKRIVLAGHASQTAGLAAAMGETVYRDWYSREAFRAPTPADLVWAARRPALT